MKGIYFSYSDTETGNSGVGRKIDAQYQSFCNHGFDMEFYVFRKPVDKWNKIVRRLPFSNKNHVWEHNKKYEGKDFIYLRRPQAMSRPFINFLKKIKQQNPQIKIIMEIPTFPYDKEMTKDWFNYPLFIKDKIARKKLEGLIDRITCVSDEKQIYGIETIKIRNGFDFQGNSVERHSDLDSINIACVAWFSFWHGYDRLINGLKSYYDQGGDYNIILHFIGEGPELTSYKELAKEVGMDSHVIFYGKKNKDEIFSILCKCNIGAGTLGMYRKGYFGLDASLKLREYMASGLPLITGAETDVSQIKELKRFVLEYPNDETIINIDIIIAYLNNLNLMFNNDENMLGRTIRLYAEKYFGMIVAMKGVFEYLDHIAIDI